MKIMTILGTRPEIIRLSLIIKKLDRLCTHILVHTGQNYSSSLNDIFFEELDIRKPDYYLQAPGNSFGIQIGRILELTEEVILKERPDKILILGDTNSGLAAIIAERLGIPVFHMEAGNRCFDLKVPEEKNRKIIDAISTYALPYTFGSRENLLKEGILKNRIFVSGNPIFEVIEYYNECIEESNILTDLNLERGKYILATIHRAENVDVKERLEIILSAVEEVQKEFNCKIIFSIHPRTKNKIEKFGWLNKNKDIIYSEPFGFFDFIKLEKNTLLVLTDSGTVQEECCIFKIPTVTIRETTERPETVECGSNIVSGINLEKINTCSKLMANSNKNWNCPEGYLDNNVSNKVVNFLLSN
ncbi:UDP-2,3-diacetamido-2,3-dideoxy-D-glucuronate 2-epimerase [Clostridium homopropionicum DSM 5847]|uniref:UDP-2,3-diacetamido-2,3-dideoxy-D-glucuronate 2-epimerase n=1 Tax=Clostridium homopropionicum DSM 5847 TaxID=1121318 RepID=A0A0L6ZBT7_9CLOT|nr:UDP-N-acetylglucosamine 2-epimerase (non-hydrolyzing) [Clostridium homopropionicum]KOA20243.1 UDP-2,3-diacetamido-2,3-dideoxy-D-glucuronate 2-epimerase [Clostridium homopropionicum DSM 5847]SFG57825.1 UDP-N-acetylglucosamine 2-epimerase (non-hydrolysing) [Clostridium homopropionicum]